ncbi:DNA polymerase IV [Paenibacillus allorhizosphaerae]|uniref:DNA polymerase IV n=1 Tax=Paenibacillus allorhizosphaerae TaxID=2849866 RepID=A0ABM8VR42_9BACL|nr:DNA polymerase IV [Paenibacillus allorhizosphaerae]CAG7654893.1 DNA polymerase IV [Paenibacillus allorhizosphaerae]
MKRIIMLADCQSFYASVEKAAHPEYADKPVAVAGDPARRSGIILAACPIAKKAGVSTAETLGEALGKCPELVVIRPRMQTYIDVSLMITEIYESFTDLVEPFSIDEQFLDVTGSLKYFGSPEAIAKQIQAKIMLATGVWSRVGIGDTKILAKTACDNFAKKNPEGIFVLPKAEVSEHLWPLPINKMFGVGGRMTNHFLRMGIHTIGELAQIPLGKFKQMLRARMGKNSDIHAELLWQTANGIDPSPVSPQTHRIAPKSVGHMMTLPRDYGTKKEIDTILLELTEEVCRDSRRKGYMGSVISVGCMCSPFDSPTGFSRQLTLPDPTNHTNTVYGAVRTLFYRFWNGLPVRRAGVALSGLVADDIYQVTLFENQEKMRALERATDAIKDRFGSAAIFRASSMTAAGQAKDRSAKIGGHYR